MASIDRTAYPRFKSSLTANELQRLYRPSDEEQQFVAKYALKWLRVLSIGLTSDNI